MEQGCVHSFSLLEDLSMSKMLAVALRFGIEEDGATMVEYGLMLAFIALICFSAVQSLGLSVSRVFPSVSASL